MKYMKNYTKKILKLLLPEQARQTVRRIASMYPIMMYSLFGKAPLPGAIVIDPVNMCNLRCPLCPTGLGIQDYEGHMMSLGAFESIVNKFPRLEKIGLYNWGEPFLNPDIFGMIKYAEKKNIEVSIHTNFSIRKDPVFFRNIIDSGLNHLTVSLDGASEETYSKYRLGGDFKLVLANINALVAEKERHDSKTPEVVWQFIVNRFNEHEVENAKHMAASIGVGFETACIGLSDDLPGVKLDSTIDERKRFWLPNDKKFVMSWYKGEYKEPLIDTPCPNLFESMVVASDGKVFPCCYLSDIKEVFGDLMRDSVDEVWNNDKYKYSRNLFTGRKYSGQTVQSACTRCKNYRKMAR
jgi:radical SAM protein with 4Fe4S-binding SPASM domain